MSKAVAKNIFPHLAHFNMFNIGGLFFNPTYAILNTHNAIRISAEGCPQF